MTLARKFTLMGCLVPVAPATEAGSTGANFALSALQRTKEQCTSEVASKKEGAYISAFEWAKIRAMDQKFAWERIGRPGGSKSRRML